METAKEQLYYPDDRTFNIKNNMGINSNQHTRHLSVKQKQDLKLYNSLNIQTIRNVVSREVNELPKSKWHK